jgi:hypothetical protein
MHRPPPIIVVLAVLALSGCAASPLGKPGDCPDFRVHENGTVPFARSPPDAQQLQAVMDELRELGPLEPAAHDRLLDDLRQSDPSLWPLVMEQFRATLAYRRRAAERNVAAEYARRLPPTDDQVIEASYTAPAMGDCPRLVVRNLAFCSEVLSYGRTRQFDKYEFSPDQETLLYAEVENFAAEPTPAGFRTSLRSDCRIIDRRGTQVVERHFAPTEDYCQSPRRDFFIVYRVRLPKDIAPGRYTLRLAIEDLQCRKVGEASIDFAVKEGKTPEIKAEEPRDKPQISR